MDEVENFVGQVRNNQNVKDRSKSALVVYDKANLKTKEEIGRTFVVEIEALREAVNVGLDTIDRLANERNEAVIEKDHYKEMLGDKVNSQQVKEVVSNKIANQKSNTKRRLAFQELEKTLKSNRALCNS